MNGFIHTIRFKILRAMVVCFILMAAISIFAVSAITRLKSSVSDSYTEVTVPILDLMELKSAQLSIRLQLRRIQTFHDPAKTQQSIDTIHTELDLIGKSWPDYYPAHVSNDQERSVADRIQGGLPQFRQMTDQVVGLLAAGKYDAAASLVNSHAEFSDSLLALIEQDVQINVDEAKKFVSDSGATAKTAQAIAFALVFAGLAVVAVTSGFLLRSISRPLKEAIGVANEIAGGKLENQIDVSARGEFGQLLRSLNAMDMQIAQTVRGIQTTAESVTVASREIASGNMDLSARTEEQAASLEETAASMTQLTETVKQNADNARQANGLATNATALADTADVAVRAMVSTIEQISASSSKISDITGVIEGIAFQTNILALNAAVEAARAGEQGRGFAVVASEVRSLAQRSALAAKEIKDLISSSVATIEGGSKQAVAVGATMGDVKQAIRRVSDIVGEIAAASEEQSRGIEQVNQAVSQMDEVTQQNAALVEQAAAAAQSLEEQAGNLKDAAAVFRLQSSPSQTRSVARPVRSHVAPVSGKAMSALAEPKSPPSAGRSLLEIASARRGGAETIGWEAF